MSEKETYVWKNGEKGQGEYLVEAKLKLKKETSNQVSPSKYPK